MQEPQPGEQAGVEHFERAPGAMLARIGHNGLPSLATAGRIIGWAER